MSQLSEAVAARKDAGTDRPNYFSPAYSLGAMIVMAVDYFAKKNTGPKAHILDPVLRDFKRGILCGTNSVPEELLAEREMATAWERRDFFREGYALGLAAVHALTFSRTNPEKRNQHPRDFRIMHYTGYGFYNAFASKACLPRITDHPKRWLDVPDFLQFGPFMTGGDAFGKLVLKRSITAKFLQSFERTMSPGGAMAAWHGCGRASWFRFTGDARALTLLLEAYSSATSAIALGVGMAITFTQVGSPDSVRASIKEFPESFHNLLIQGGGVALAGMVVENPGESERVYTLYTGDLRRRLDQALQAAEDARRGTEAAPERWYRSFFDRLEAKRSSG